jgi:hypothetical protein
MLYCTHDRSLRCGRSCTRKDCKFKHPVQTAVEAAAKQQNKPQGGKHGVKAGDTVHVHSRSPFIPDGVATVTAVDKDGISVRFPNLKVYSGIQPDEFTKPQANQVNAKSKRMAYILMEHIYDYMAVHGHAIGELIAEFDADGDGFISREELYDSMASITGGQLHATMLSEAVSAIDTDGDMRISIDELDKALHEAQSEFALPNQCTDAASARIAI